MQKIGQVKRSAKEALSIKSINVFGKEQSNWGKARLGVLLFKIFSKLIGVFAFLLILHSIYMFNVQEMGWGFFEFLGGLFDWFFDVHPNFFRYFWAIFFGDAAAWIVLIIFTIIYRTFILRPIEYGHHLFYANAIWGNIAKTDDMFKSFSKELYKPVVVTALLRKFFLILWSMIIVGVVFLGTLLIIRLTNYGYVIWFYSSYFATYFLMWFAFGSFVGAFFGALIFLIIKRLAYSMATHIVLKDQKISGVDAIDKSRVLMKGNKFRLFLLHLSFIGWHCLSVLTLGVLHIVYVGPYMMASKVAFFEEIIKTNVLGESIKEQTKPLLNNEIVDYN